MPRHATGPSAFAALALSCVIVFHVNSMRTRAERALGSRFDVREFHRQVLDTGAIPLPVPEAKVNAWLASARG